MRTYLLGGVVTKVDEHWDKTLPNLMAEAGLKSLEAVGLSTVDAVYATNV